MMKKLFVIGDSISIHYGPVLQKKMEGSFVYGRKGINDHVYRSSIIRKGTNGADSNSVLAYLQEKKENGFYSDVLLLNCGLHDIKINRETGERVCTIKQYEENLKESISIASGLCNTLIWITTTSFDEERHTRLNTDNYRYTKDNEEYKRVAEKIMRNNGITVIDLDGYTKTLGTDLRSDHVHFEDWIAEKQGIYIAKTLLLIFDLK